MMKNIIGFTALALLLTSCWGWTDERKQKILDKCNEAIYNCDCVLEKTMDHYPEPDDYNTKAEDDDAYYEKLESCIIVAE